MTSERRRLYGPRGDRNRPQGPDVPARSLAEQADPREWVEAYCDLVLKWRPNFWAEEKTQITSGIGPFIERRSIERKAWIQREQFPTRGDKATRAASIRGRMALIGLHVPAFTVAS